MRPTRRGVGIAMLGFAVALLPTLGVAGSWQMVVAFWAALLVAYIVDAGASARRGTLRHELQLPAQLYVGRTEVMQLTLTLPVRRPRRAQVVVDLSDLLEPHPTLTRPVSSVPSAMQVPLRPRRRGTAVVQRIWVQYHSPLGLLWWQVMFALDREVPVLPDIPLVRQTALQYAARRSTRVGFRIEHYTGDGTEFDSMRDFVPGDDSRAVDWSSSARMRKLVCRQFRAERNHQVIIAIDTGRLMAEPLGGVTKLDHALNAALVLAYVSLRAGDRVSLFTFGAAPGITTTPTRGASTMPRLIRAAAAADYSTHETNYTLALTVLAQRLRRRSLIIVVTDFADTITAELMIENVGRLVGRHLVVFVSLRDPLLTELSESEPTSPADLNRAVVAHTLSQDRALVHERLRRLGVFAIDAEPAAVNSALLNRYLEIKRRELV